MTTDWTALAACRGTNPEIFFPTRIDTTDAATAAAFCDHCPVAPQCLHAAHTEPRTYGVRAGHLFEAGHPTEITKRPPRARHHRTTPARTSVQHPAEIRTAVIAAYQAERGLYDSDRQCHFALADRYGVSRPTIRTWTTRAVAVPVAAA